MPPRDIAFSLTIAVALALTLGVKAIASDFGAVADGKTLTADIARAMHDAGYETTIEPHPYQSDVVIARRAGCMLRLRDGTLESDFDEVFRAQAGGLPQFAYWYRGQALDTVPTLEAQLREYAARTAARLGLSASFSPPIAVAASPGCDLARLPLRSVAMHYIRPPLRPPAQAATGLASS